MVDGFHFYLISAGETGRITELGNNTRVTIQNPKNLEVFRTRQNHG